MKFQILIFSICLFYLSSHAQDGEYFLQKHINSENGLPQNTVRDLMFSPAGFLWIATENGLVRYDGKSILTYTITNSGLIKNRISQLIPMNNGQLYCSAEGENVSEILESNNTTNVKFIKKIKHVGFSSYHLFKTDSLALFEKISSYIFPENYTEANKSTIFILSDKNLIIQRYKKGLAVFNSNMDCIKKIIIPKIHDFDFFISNNELYCKNKLNEFYHLKLLEGNLVKCHSTLRKYKFDNTSTFRINEDVFLWDYKTNSCYYIIQNSLYEIVVQRDTIRFELKLRTLPNYVVNSITCSNDKQSLVIGTKNSGIFIYGKKKFRTFTSPYSDNAFYAQAYSSKNKCIYTSMPFIQFDLQGKSNILNDSIINKFALYSDSQDRIFYFQGNNLNAFNTAKRTTSLIATIPSFDNETFVDFIAKKDSNSIFISSNSCLYSFSEKKGLLKLNDYEDNSQMQRTYCLQKYSDSIYYIATDIGLYKYNSSNHTLKLSCLEGINLRSLFLTHNNILLAGSYDKGYYVIQNDKPITIPLDKNENLKSAHAFIEDSKGFLWISSNNGLYKIELKEIVNYISNRHNKILYYYRYSSIDGLLTNEFNGGCCPNSLQIDSLTWSFPSMQGLVLFSPLYLNSTFNNNPIFIDKIILDDSVVNNDITKTIDTRFHKFKLSLFISSPNWSDDNNLYIEYALDPTSSNAEWILLKDNQAPIIIQNLTGGYHKILIRKKNGNGFLDYTTTEVTIHVPKLINEYWWFWPAAILLILLTIFGSVKLATYVISRQKIILEKMVNQKTIQLQEAVHVLEEKNITIKKSEESLSKENELKNTLLFLLSHDIASPLRFINMFLTGVAHSGDMANMSKEDLVDLTISTQNLEALLNNIVAWIKQTLDTFTEIEMEEVQLQTLLQEKLNLFQLAIKKKNNQVVNELPVDLTLRTNQFILSMALQNILGNAINYAKNGIIRIAYQETVSAHEISVLDTGNKKQIDQHDVLTGYGIGLKITNELLKMIDGEIKLESIKNNEGMKATIYIRKK